MSYLSRDLWLYNRYEILFGIRQNYNAPVDASAYLHFYKKKILQLMRHKADVNKTDSLLKTSSWTCVYYTCFQSKTCQEKCYKIFFFIIKNTRKE